MKLPICDSCGYPFLDGEYDPKRQEILCRDCIEELDELDMLDELNMPHR